MKQNEEEEYLLLHPIPRTVHIIAVLFLAILLFLQRTKLFFGPNTYYLGGSHADAGLYLWLFRHHLHYLTEIPFFETNAFFPYPLTLAWSDNFILPALITFPLFALGIDVATLYNGTLLLGEFLAAYCTFRLAYLLIGNKNAALISGAIPLSMAFFTSSLGHPQLAFGFVFPLGLEILFRSIQKPLRCGIAFGVLVTATFLTTVYYAIFLSFLPFAFFSAHLLLRPTKQNLTSIPRFLLGGLLSLPLLAPWALPYIEVKRIFGARAADEMAAFGAQGTSFISASPLSQLYSFTSYLSHAEAYFFPGVAILFLFILSLFRLFDGKPLRTFGRITFLTLIALLILSSYQALLAIGISRETVSLFRQTVTPLCAYGVILLYAILLQRLGQTERFLNCHFLTNRAIVGILSAVALLFFVISLGPLGRATQDEFQWGPFMLLYSFFPGFDSVRAISRAAIPSLFIMALLAGFAISRITEKHIPTRPLFSFILIPLFLIENLLIAYPIEPRDGAPAVLKHLQSIQTPHDAVLFLPMTDSIKPNKTVQSWKNFATRNVDYMNWSIDYSLLTVNGYSGQRTKVMRTLPGITKSFPDDASIKAFAQIANLSYIVYAPKFVSDFQKEAFEERLRYYANDLEFILSDAEGFYLIRFKGEIKIHENTTIRASLRWPDEYFSFELKSTYEVDAPDIAVSIKELDHHKGESFHTLLLPQDGRWHTFTVKLPEQTTPAIPFRFSFVSEDGIKLFYKNGAIRPLASRLAKPSLDDNNS